MVQWRLNGSDGLKPSHEEGGEFWSGIARKEDISGGKHISNPLMLRVRE